MRGMKRLFLEGLLWCMVCAALTLSYHGEAPALEGGIQKEGVTSTEISADILWKGEISVSGKVTVLAGATLTIAPRTTVRFAEGSELVIKGRIKAIGEPDGPITFTSLKKKEPSAWGEVSLEAANGSEIAHCIFEYATWGLHSHFTHVLVRDSSFRKNFGGMRFMSGLVEIRHSLFEENKIGVRWRSGSGLIEGNVITRNEVGLFVKEKGGKLTIKNNDIFGNSGYNIRVGDFVNEDVNAQSNWWGPGNPASKIYDGNVESGLGKVRYEPYLMKPVRQSTEGAR